MCSNVQCLILILDTCNFVVLTYSILLYDYCINVYSNLFYSIISYVILDLI